MYRLNSSALKYLKNSGMRLVPHDGLDGFHFGAGLGHRAADPELVIARSVRNDKHR